MIWSLTISSTARNDAMRSVRFGRFAISSSRSAEPRSWRNLGQPHDLVGDRDVVPLQLELGVVAQTIEELLERRDDVEQLDREELFAFEFLGDLPVACPDEAANAVDRLQVLGRLLQALVLEELPGELGVRVVLLSSSGSVGSGGSRSRDLMWRSVAAITRYSPADLEVHLAHQIEIRIVLSLRSRRSECS
jgi:hypothetical protein